MTVVKIKRKLKFENYEKCLEGNQIENKINHLEKKIDVVRENIKEHNPHWPQIHPY